MRDAIGDLASLAWAQVTKQPIVCESPSTDPSSVTLIADLRLRGVWQPQVDILFDVRFTDVDAPSYRSRSPQAVLCSTEAEKKCKYMEACLARHASFTPLCFSTDGMFGTEADVFFVAWLSGCLLSGRGHTVKLLAGFDQDFRLQYFRPLCCVCRVHDQDGNLWALWMERLFLNLTDILLQLAVDYFNCMFLCIVFCVALFVLLCVVVQFNIIIIIIMM